VSEQQHQHETPGTWLGEIESHFWALRPEVLRTLLRLAAEGQLEERIRTTEAARQPSTYKMDTWHTVGAAGEPAFQNGFAQAGAEAVQSKKQPGRPKAINGAVAKVPLKGVLAPMSGLLAMLFDLEDPLVAFERNLKGALADPDVGAVVIEVDSPGGVVDGIPEAAAMVRQLRGSKPIVAHANTMAASAAYWLASQADEVVVTPSGAVGSIGVYAAHRDMSGQGKLLGVETTLVSAGKYKTDGNPWEPLSESARAKMQHDVDHFYNLFAGDVAKGRGVKVADVKAGYGEGAVLNAKDALAANLVDRVETISETTARLSSRSRGGAPARAEADAPELTVLEEAEATAGADEETTSDDKAEVLDALFRVDDDPVLAARALDKIAAAAS